MCGSSSDPITHYGNLNLSLFRQLPALLSLMGTSSARQHYSGRSPFQAWFQNQSGQELSHSLSRCRVSRSPPRLSLLLGQFIGKACCHILAVLSPLSVESYNHIRNVPSSTRFDGLNSVSCSNGAAADEAFPALDFIPETVSLPPTQSHIYLSP